MPTFTITYLPETGLPTEDVEADDARVEAGGQIVLRRTVLVMAQPRDVVVRRLPGAQVVSVEQSG